MSNAIIIRTPPFFSIVVTTYNRAKLLKRALDSLVAQTERDWEAVVVDDGSTDNTYPEIKPYLNAFPKIKYLQKAHNGTVKSKNEGILAATGRYVSFLDSDDEYKPHHLECRKRILVENPEIKFLYGGVKILGNQFVPDRFDHAISIPLKKCVIGGTFFIERKALLQLNGFAYIPIGADAHLFDRAMESHLNMMETVTQTYIYHHETQDSITNNFLPNQVCVF